MTIRVVVVDGHTLFRYGLTTLTATAPDIKIVAEAGTAATAPAIVASYSPDVVTIDVALPDGDGLRLARELRDRHDDLGIVMLTSLGEDDVLFRALETGTSAFVAKTAPADEVLAAIRHASVAAGSFTAAGLAGALARKRTTDDRLALSPREREVLLLLREGTSIPSIARSLYVSQSTAKTYVSRLYEKLGASNRAQALMAALRAGLIRTEQTHAS
ncbi:response regulator transcription factor [Saccharothrix sp. NPDC042600]|uniref:response regulator transcription factor n=1 Tax=Saccharothrix TaxID=2071 RepID=UPI0033DCC1EB|nr:response regulator transcription factor [Saccharothrix mutabilis subsp. capreolus]